MADNLPDEIERLLLDWLLTDAAVERPVLPLKIRLMSAAGTDAAPGTEVVGDTYPPGGVVVTFDPAETVGATVTGPPADVVVGMIDSVAEKTIVAAEVWDSGATPRRILHGAFASALVVPATVPVRFAMADLTMGLG